MELSQFYYILLSLQQNEQMCAALDILKIVGKSERYLGYLIEDRADLDTYEIVEMGSLDYSQLYHSKESEAGENSMITEYFLCEKKNYNFCVIIRGKCLNVIICSSK